MKSSSFLTILLIPSSLIICIYFFIIQPPNNFAGNEKADANEYLKIYEYFQGERDWTNIRFGIHNRVAIPFLASTLPWNDAVINFFVLNSILVILSVLALYYVLLHFNIKSNQILLILIFFSLHYVGPFRQNAVGPVNVDMAVYLFESVFLLLLLKRNYLWLIILTPLAVSSKELILALIIVIFLYGIFLRIISRDKSLSIPGLAGMLVIGLFTKWILNEYFPSTSPERNSILVMAFHLREIILNPDHLWRWILSLFAAFGGFLFLLVRKHQLKKINFDDRVIIHVLSLSVLALSILGGMDYTRLIFLGFPYIIISIFLFTKPQTVTVLFSFFISLIISRFWVAMPIISTDMSLYNAWMPEWANNHYLLAWTAALFISFGVFYLLNKLLAANFQD